MEETSETHAAPDLLRTLEEIRAESRRAVEMLLTPGCPDSIKGLTALRKIEVMARDRAESWSSSGKDRLAV